MALNGFIEFFQKGKVCVVAERKQINMMSFTNMLPRLIE